MYKIFFRQFAYQVPAFGNSLDQILRVNFIEQFVPFLSQKNKETSHAIPIKIDHINENPCISFKGFFFISYWKKQFFFINYRRFPYAYFLIDAFKIKKNYIADIMKKSCNIL